MARGVIRCNKISCNSITPDTKVIKIVGPLSGNNMVKIKGGENEI
jgi:hypothetical protein